MPSPVARQAILLSGTAVKPVWQANFLTASSLPAGLTASGGANGTYFNSSGILTSGSAPRFDYNPATLAARGLLIEEARTNLLAYSNSPLGHWSASGIDFTANAATSPDGTANAGHLKDQSTASAVHTFFESVTVASGSITGSAFFQAAEYAYGAIALVDAAGNRYGAVASLPANGTGAITATTTVSSPTGTSSSVQYVGNGWYRIIATMATGAGTGYLLISSSPTAVPSFSTGVPTYTGVVGSGTYFYGGQIEQGAFATSYIPNLSSGTTTRTADVVTFAGVPLAALQGAKGTLYVETSDFPPVNAVSISDSAYHLYLANYNGSTTTMSAPSLSQAVPSGTTASIQRTGLKWNAAGASLVVSGSSISTTGTPIVSPSNAYLGSNGSATFLDGHVRSIGMFNTDLINLAFKAKSNIGAPY